MSDIFLITFTDMDYESFPEPIGYTTSEELAKSEVKRLNDLHQEVHDFRDKIYEHLKELNKIHEGPEKEKRLDRIPWKPGLGKEQITEKMKAERTLIELKNKKIDQRNNALGEEYDRKIGELLSEFKQSLEISEDVKKLDQENKDSWYSVNPKGHSYSKVSKIK